MALTSKIPKPRMVSEFMQADVVTVPANATVDEVARMLIERGISGAPVVDREGTPIGVVSQTDLLSHRVQRVQADAETDEDSSDRPTPTDVSGITDTQPITRQATAEMVMTPLVLSVSRDADIRTAARLMVTEKVHRLLVTDNDQLVGIVTTLDLLRALVNEPLPA